MGALGRLDPATGARGTRDKAGETDPDSRRRGRMRKVQGNSSQNGGGMVAEAAPEAPAERLVESEHSGYVVPVSEPVLNACGMAWRRMGDAAVGSLAVTSSVRGEGRTTLAVGFAAAIRAQGRKTILLDLDILHRSIQTLLPVKAAPGVVEFLAGQASLDDCIQPAGADLEVVTAGLAQSIGDGRFKQIGALVSDLRSRCDVLVADLPPLEAGVSAARMADLFQSVALVVRAGGVTIPEIEQAMSVLGNSPHVILNAANRPGKLGRVFGRRR
jgi:Mrp family chromosome partitioning ATPase